MFRGHTPLKIYDHCLRYLQSFSTQRSRQRLLFNSTLRTTIAPTVQDPKEDPTVQDPTVQGDRTTTRFKRQPAAPIHPHHSIAKDSDQCRKRRNEAIKIDWGASNVQRNAMPSSCPFKQYRCNVLLPFAHCVLKDLEKADRAMISYSNYELRYATRRSLSPVIENGDENPPLQDPTACG